MITKRRAIHRTHGTKHGTAYARRGFGKAKYMAEDMETFKAIIVGLREEALKELESLRGNISDHSAAEGDGEVDLQDRAYQSSISEADAELISHQTELVAQLDAALDRIKQHEYGRCEVCGAPIDRMRLMAVPHTRTCFACKSAPRQNIIPN